MGENGLKDKFDIVVETGAAAGNDIDMSVVFLGRFDPISELSQVG